MLLPLLLPPLLLLLPLIRQRSSRRLRSQVSVCMLHATRGAN
jgi:hypothetical protein